MITSLRARVPTTDLVLLGAAALGCVALAARSHAPVSVIPTALVGIIGAVALRHPGSTADIRSQLGVTAAGCAVFAAALALGDAWAPPLAAFGAFTLVLAAVAEEAFFRRFMQGWLEWLGPLVSIAIPAVLFGLIHVPAYGWAILPLDIAAGTVLGWQRAVTGSWLVPAFTHAFANLVVFA